MVAVLVVKLYKVETPPMHVRENELSPEASLFALFSIVSTLLVFCFQLPIAIYRAPHSRIVLSTYI